jgi:hypothetical protein
LWLRDEVRPWFLRLITEIISVRWPSRAPHGANPIVVVLEAKLAAAMSAAALVTHDRDFPRVRSLCIIS